MTLRPRRTALLLSALLGAGAALGALPAAPASAATPADRAVPAALRSYLTGDRTDLQWALAATGTPRAWRAGTGVGVTVATIDTGADPTAPDLAGVLVPGAHLDPGSGSLVAGNVADTFGHGTHVAGIIAGRADGHGITGVAPGARVMPVNLDSGGNGLTGVDVAAGLRWARSHGARVVNLSLGFSDVALQADDIREICTAVSEVVAAGVVVVAAAGNDGLGSNDAIAPADCPGSISVAALDSTLHAAAWSSFDGTVTVAAPGQDIYSTVPTSVSPLGYAAMSGTSMATPFVAGVAALLVGLHPDWTPAQVSRRIAATALDVGAPGTDPRTGAGAVNPAAALGVAGPAPQPTPELALSADPAASRVDSSGRPVFDQVTVHWVPDPSADVTGYRITRWTSSGVTTRDVSSLTVRSTFASSPAGYQVTALGPGGGFASPPVWFPVAGQDFTPVLPVVGLRAGWRRDAGLDIAWTNPPANAGRADIYVVSVNGEIVAQGDRVAIPHVVRVPAARVPAGDLVVSVLVGSSSSYDIEETRTTLVARVPFSGTAVNAGRVNSKTGRYRVDLELAESRKPICGGRRCTGVRITLSLGKRRYVNFLDARGHLVCTVSGPLGRRSLTLGVSVPAYQRLSMAGVRVAVG